MKFDIFTIRQWREGYTLEVKIGRPQSEPHNKHTKADTERARAANEKNMELIGRMFATLEEVFEEMKALQFPTEEGEKEQ